jgi:hypothetical protein
MGVKSTGYKAAAEADDRIGMGEQVTNGADVAAAGNLDNEHLNGDGVIAMSSASKVQSRQRGRGAEEGPDSCRIVFQTSSDAYIFPTVLGQTGCKLCVLTIHPNKISDAAL